MARSISFLLVIMFLVGETAAGLCGNIARTADSETSSLIPKCAGVCCDMSGDTAGHMTVHDADSQPDRPGEALMVTGTPGPRNGAGCCCVQSAPVNALLISRRPMLSRDNCSTDRLGSGQHSTLAASFLSVVNIHVPATDSPPARHLASVLRV